MEVLFTTDGIISLLTLTLMEVVLGIDNIVFIAIISGKLPRSQQKRARTWGNILAVIPRVILLLFISWLVGLHDKLVDFSLLGHSFYVTEKGMVLLVGGIFLLYKAVTEIHAKLEGEEDQHANPKAQANSFMNTIIQIVLLNIVFSLDSILTAVGLAKDVLIMILAVVISLLITLSFAGRISDFVEKHPTVKMLALSFLLLIGFLLVTESFVVDGHEVHVPKGYIYFAMAFSLFVEVLNLRLRKGDPVKLHNRFDEEEITDYAKH
jgi:predicted tellurium resistance membrane protein TerC